VRASSALVSLVLLPSLLSAQDSLALAPNIEFVVSGGTWSFQGASGSFRVVVRTGGFDHIISDLYVQWLQDPRNEDDSATVRASTKVDSLSGIWALDQPRFSCTSSCVVEVSGTDTHTMAKSSWVLTLGPPGRVQVQKR
jgi:hypothetical protein